MEVHAHAHTPRKKWTHYFYEFLMLFLAVFCGFMAENIREHSIEHQREKKYMRAMLGDLQSDSIMLDLYQTRMAEQGLGLDTLMTALNLPLSNHLNLQLVYIMYLKYGQYYFLMPFNENTSSQLKSGGLRMIRNDSVQMAIYEYDKMKHNVSINASAFQKLIAETESLQANSLFDFSRSPSIINLTTTAWFGVKTDSLIKRSEKDSLKLITSSFERIATFRNMIRSIKSMNVNLYNWTMRTMENNGRLRRMIKKEYHLSERTPLEE